MWLLSFFLGEYVVIREKTSYFFRQRKTPLLSSLLK